MLQVHYNGKLVKITITCLANILIAPVPAILKPLLPILPISLGEIMSMELIF